MRPRTHHFLNKRVPHDRAVIALRVDVRGIVTTLTAATVCVCVCHRCSGSLRTSCDRRIFVSTGTSGCHRVGATVHRRTSRCGLATRHINRLSLTVSHAHSWGGN